MDGAPFHSTRAQALAGTPGRMPIASYIELAPSDHGGPGRPPPYEGAQHGPARAVHQQFSVIGERRTVEN